MRRAIRLTGTLLVLAGVGMLLWTFTVWRWQDPVTAVYTHMEQRELARGYDALLAASRAAAPAEPAAALDPEEARRRVAAAAERLRDSLATGQPVGRLSIPRLGLTTMIVEGTDNETLKRGPGRYRDLFLPGEGELVYVAGHRTTYSAPFARIDELQPGDVVTIEVPYGNFTYRIVRHRIVPETEVSVLKSPGEELLALQACHPRFFASHRYIAYAELVEMTPHVAALDGADAAPAP